MPAGDLCCQLAAVILSRAMLATGFVHRIDPIFAEVGRVYLWWYGLRYTLGFLGTHLWLRRVARRSGIPALPERIPLFLGLAAKRDASQRSA